MFDTCEQTGEFALIEAIAAALREELGVAIEEQPGFRDPSEAGQVNRAFRVMARTILRTIAPPDEDLPALLSRVLGRLARRRLEAGLLDAREVDHLLGLELGGRDDWLAFLILTDWSEIEYLLQTRGPTTTDPGPASIDHIPHQPDPSPATGGLHDARRAFVGVRARRLHRPLGPVVRARRRDRRDRPPLPPAALGPGHLGHRPRPESPRPGRGLRHGRQCRRPAGGDPLARGDGQPRRHLAARPAQLQPVPQQHRGRPGPRLGHRRRQDRADLRRRPLGRREDPGRAGAPVRGHRARPARPRPARADRPRDRHRARRAARGRRADGRARRGGRADPGRGRERLEPVAGPAQPGHAGRALGAEGPDAKEKRPADAAPGRRDLRRPGRAGGPQVVLHPRPAAGAAGRCPGPRRAPARTARFGEVGLCQGPGQRDRPAHVDARRRLAHGLPDRPDRGADPPGAADRRRDGAVRHHDR